MTMNLTELVLFAATEAEATESIVPGYLKLLITAGAFLIPYGLGVLIARQLKLKEYAFRISLVLFAATLGLMPFLYQGIVGAMEKTRYEEAKKEYEDQPSNASLIKGLRELDAELEKENRNLVIKLPELRGDAADATPEPPSIKSSDEPIDEKPDESKPPETDDSPKEDDNTPSPDDADKPAE